MFLEKIVNKASDSKKILIMVFWFVAIFKESHYKLM